MRHATKNTAGCCDGHGQVHWVCGDDPHYVGVLSGISLCHNAVCETRREAEFAHSCGEEPGTVNCFYLGDAVEVAPYWFSPTDDPDQHYVATIVAFESALGSQWVRVYAPVGSPLADEEDVVHFKALRFLARPSRDESHAAATGHPDVPDRKAGSAGRRDTSAAPVSASAVGSRAVDGGEGP